MKNLRKKWKTDQKKKKIRKYVDRRVHYSELFSDHLYQEK